MRIGKWILLLLSIGLLLQAEEFGPVVVEQIPMPESPGYRNGYAVAAFRVVNRLKTKPAEVVFSFEDAMRGFWATRTVLVPPDSTRTVDLGWPITVADNALLHLQVNGKSYQTTIGARRNWAETPMLFAGEIASNDILREILSERETYHGRGGGGVPLSAGQWPADLRVYYGIKNIVLDSEALPPPATMKTLEEWVALGGSLVLRVAPEAPWPEGTPGSAERYHCKRIEFGRIIVVRPLLPGDEKIVREYLKRQKVSDQGRQRSAERNDLKTARKHALLMQLKAELDGERSVPVVELRHVAYPPPRIPLGMLAAVMGIFVLLIGPVNYLILRRKKKEMWLLVTVPAISFSFCILVILFITFSEGWYSRGKALGETRLDQSTGRAVTLAAMSFYAPLPPGGGFLYQPDELLTFSEQGRVRLSLDRGQQFDSSLLAPRIPLNVRLQSVRERREQLRISVAEGGKALEVINGLGAPLSALAVVAPDGRIFLTERTVPAGEKILLTESVGRSTAEKAPETLCFERSAHELGRLLPPGFYAAYFSQAHFYSTGILPEKFAARHLVIGKYGEKNHAN